MRALALAPCLSLLLCCGTAAGRLLCVSTPQLPDSSSNRAADKPEEWDEHEAAAIAASYHHARDTQAAQPDRGPRCVCAFDFDNTLRVAKTEGNRTNYDAPATEALAVLAACGAVPCQIALASANHNWQKIQRVLPRLYGDANVFTDAFWNSPAFQFGYHNKTISLEALSRWFDVPGPCIVLFDDAEYNKPYTKQLGVHFELVKASRGVEYWNFERAMRALPWECKQGKSPAVLSSSGP